MQTLDLRRSAQIVWRRKAVVFAVAVLGLLFSVVFAMFHPPVYTGSTFVAVPPTVSIGTQALIMNSEPVLVSAARRADLGEPVAKLRGRIRVTSAAYELMSVSAQGASPAQAERVVNAVTLAYIAYVGSPASPVGQVPTRLMARATFAVGPTPTMRLAASVVPGVLSGLLVGIIIALAAGRADRRLRERDEIANAITVPVLASVRARRPAAGASWAETADHSPPGAAEAADTRRLRKVLRELGVADVDGADSGPIGDHALAVITLAGDRTALSLGPRLAAAAAAAVPTALVIDQYPGANPSAPARRMGLPRMVTGSQRNRRHLAARTLDLVVRERDGDSPPEPGRLSVVVAVVDRKAPSVAQTLRAATTVLGVTSGAATAEELARVVASAVGDGRVVSGILVANPSRLDQTTGRVAHLAQPGQNMMPTRMTDAVTGTRR